MSSKRELREAIRQWAETTFAISRQRDEARAERDDIRDQLAQAIAEREEMAQEVIAAHRERDNLRADLAQARLDLLDPTPEPRPFRVGDRVRVTEGATYRVGLSGTLASRSAGRVGVVREVWSDGDLIIDTEAESGCAASPEFCTLIEAESEVVLPLPEGYTFTAPEANVPAPPEPSTPAVVVTWPDGVVARYDRYPDDVEFQGSAWVIKDDANRVLAVVDGVRSIEVVR